MSTDTCGVYAIEELGAGRFYIGSARGIRRRWYGHRWHLDRGTHHAKFLQCVWAKRGPEAFDFYVLEECSPDQLLIREQSYLDALSPVFNTNVLAASRLGTPQGPETRAKMSRSHRLRTDLITYCPRGHPYDVANTYFNKKGKRICRACNALRVSAVYASETPEQHEARRTRASAYAHCGRADRWSPEHRAKISAGLVGRALSLEARAKISAAKKGRPLSMEHRANMSTAQKARYLKENTA